jgi:hypothetical protein
MTAAVYCFNRLLAHLLSFHLSITAAASAMPPGSLPVPLSFAAPAHAFRPCFQAEPHSADALATRRSGSGRTSGCSWFDESFGNVTFGNEPLMSAVRCFTTATQPLGGLELQERGIEAAADLIGNTTLLHNANAVDLTLSITLRHGCMGATGHRATQLCAAVHTCLFNSLFA